MLSPNSQHERQNDINRRKQEKKNVDINKASENMFTRLLRRSRDGWGMLSTESSHKKDSFSVADAVGISDPKNSLLKKKPEAITVNTLPGAIQSTATTFDAEPVTLSERDANTLPGAIGLKGSFDGNNAVVSNPGIHSGPKHNLKQPIRESSSSAARRRYSNSQVAAGKHEKKKGTMSTKPSKSTSGSIPSSSATRSGKEGFKKGKVKSLSRPAKPSGQKRVSKRKRKAGKTGTSSKEEGNEPSSSRTSTNPESDVSRKKSSDSVNAKHEKQSERVEAGENSESVMYNGPHPMNRDMSELQVSGGIGTLEENAIRAVYEKLVKAYLAPFADGIKRRSFFEVLRRKTYSLTPPGANKGIQTILFQIIDSKLYLMDPYEVTKNSKPFYRSRIKELIWLLSEVAKDGKVPNTEFLLAIHDCVQTVHKEHTYRGAVFKESNPTFTIVACNFSDNLAFPMWEGDEVRGGLKSWDEKMESYRKADTIPWAEKKPQAVFRGGNRPSMYFKKKKDADEHCDEVGRSRLRHIGEENPQLFDVGVSGTCGGKTHSLSRLSEADHHKYKYILYAEGNCFWADRLNKQVFGPSAIIKQETPCGQFWEPLLKPMTHYIPTDFFFQNTAQQIEWAKGNDEKVQEIVKNANEFASNFLSFKGIKIYVEELLTEYTKLLSTTKIKPEKGSEDVTV